MCYLLYIYIYIYIYIKYIFIGVYHIQRWSVTKHQIAQCKEHRYIFKNGKIKLKYSCNSEFHAKAIIRHIIYLKERYNNHKGDVKHIKYQYNTELIKYIWNLKNNSIKYNIQWKVVDNVYGSANLTMCKLCLTEKLWIINQINNNNILNKKSELINKCRHLKKFLLKQVKKTVNFSFMRICIFVFSF